MPKSDMNRQQVALNEPIIVPFTIKLRPGQKPGPNFVPVPDHKGVFTVWVPVYGVYRVSKDDSAACPALMSAEEEKGVAHKVLEGQTASARMSLKKLIKLSVPAPQEPSVA